MRGVALLGPHAVRELCPRLHGKLPEHLAQVVLDGARADEELRGDLSVRPSLRDEAGDLRLLWSELVAGSHRACAGALARRQQLALGAAREPLDAHASECLEGRAQLL